ncbi:MAG: 4-hydroxybenzoate octaprenyltransferase [Acidobacteria bacterium]|jgi:4-hydroxybenzoate polyprenyltransferase|nr:4-hydroxybenzoate octaprenyltransferase [Acidobacteriota bacterium]MDP7480834.1 UbiA-like polyprenyltransferase [Vicinamibacterales bacterium]MDP7691891.1 UbiA-like polyprenyltransferase [Vicinamibacterales bacterium]HJN43668.1 UbiA-like polyprenyltransferase [Vicinamibacterales bacterium]|tara:strand:- start:3091 stop:3945 length:855 start_codon:yes stop_codon:yes gene_type:complete
MLRRLRTYAAFVRFGHSVFALPFALVGALLAAQQTPLTTARVVWIVAAMVTARTAAMAFNRVVDARFDAMNPRTANRELPRGVISSGEAVSLVVVASIAFILVTTRLGWICLALSPVALAVVFSYSLAKRFTTYTQLLLGVALAIAPVGGWLAAGGRWGWEPWLLAIATGAWVAGFDIYYACQDLEFDRAQGLRSIPARFGVRASLGIARWLHVVAVMALAGVALVTPLGLGYLAGVAGVALLLAYEQSLVRPDDLSRVKQAFDLNGYVGLFYLAATAAAIYVG